MGSLQKPAKITHLGDALTPLCLLDEHLEFEQFEPREFVAQGDTVVVVGFERSLSKATGHTIETEWAHVYTLRDGKIAKGRFFEDTAAYVAAFHRRGV